MLTQSGTTVPTQDTAFLSETDPLSAFTDRSLLIVDDDKPFSTRLAGRWRAAAMPCRSPRASEGVAAVEAKAPAFAVIDMRQATATGST